MGKFVPQILRDFEIAWAAGEADEWETHAAWFWKQSGIYVKMKRRSA